MNHGDSSFRVSLFNIQKYFKQLSLSILPEEDS